MNVHVVIPTFNERDNLPSLLDALLGQGEYRVLVVDDASPDGTGAIADGYAARHPGRVSVLHREGPRGLGRSYIAGFISALEAGADLVVQMDADFSHDPRYLPDLVGAADHLDLVIGSRYVHGISVVNWPLRRLVLSTFANWYVRAIVGLEVADCTAGYRCWRREALSRIPLSRIASDGYSFQVEMLFEAHRLGCRIGEVPIIFVERRQGQSKMTKGVILESAWMPWRLRLRSLTERARTSR